MATVLIIGASRGIGFEAVKAALAAGHSVRALARSARKSPIDHPNLEKLDWMIVRPVILTDGPKTNAYRALVDARDWTCGFISRADVADFLIKQIDDNAFLHKTPVLMS